ncbi:MAG TPA: hypothetical protein VF377_14040 [Acidimicrobiia bacterium]|jgi:hypothetical protein
MDLDRRTMELLRPAAERLRKVLQRMDDEDVPAPLRRLAESSDRRLPPPILKRALAELDTSEWLREEVLADSELDPDSPADLFIRRPEGWEERLEDMAAAAAARAEERDRGALERELAAARKRITELQAATKAEAEQLARVEQKTEQRFAARLAAAERARRDAEQRAREAERQATRLAAELDRMRDEVSDLQTRIEGLRQLLEKERRSGGGPPVLETRGWFPTEPEALAVELDRITAALRRPPGLGEEPSVVAAEALRIPKDLRPDRIEAIHWLLHRRVRWLIDGYNLAHLLSPEGGAGVRRRVVESAGRLVTLSPPGTLAVVIFDSSVDQAEIPTSRRVRVLFEGSADEWIIDAARPGDVVVTSDRRVREAAEAKGAQGVWSEALVAWIDAGYTLA